MIYSDPGERARGNSRAEESNKIIEAGIQCLLYEKNLPPSWWQRAANDIQFLGNRHPPYSLDANVPLDGDMASPIERRFLGYVTKSPPSLQRERLLCISKHTSYVPR